MRFHPTGLIMIAVIVLLTLSLGAVPAVGVLRVAVVVFVTATVLEIVVNMIRHREITLRGRLWDFLRGQVNSLGQSSQRSKLH